MASLMHLHRIVALGCDCREAILDARVGSTSVHSAADDVRARVGLRCLGRGAAGLLTSAIAATLQLDDVDLTVERLLLRCTSARLSLLLA